MMAVALDDAFGFIQQFDHGVLVTLKRDGRPQLSNILYVPEDGDDHLVRISVTDSRAKTRNLRRDPRASLYVTREDFFAYVVLEGTVALSPPARSADDAVVAELREMYELAVGDHPDWDEFAEAMVEEKRVVATLRATNAYGMVGS